MKRRSITTEETAQPMSPPVVPRWAPRLARLYSEDVRKLEALHAGRISPGATTWEEAVDQLASRMISAGPAKGAKLVGKAIDYLSNIAPDHRCHFLISTQYGSRNAFLMFATFSIGNHPNPTVKEEGLNIELHVLQCSRSHPSRAIGIPTAFISRHAINRLFERGHDVTGNSHATGVFAFIGVLGYLTHKSAKHTDGGMHIVFSGLLTAGAMHRFTKTCRNGKQVEETVYDVRTVLLVDELGDSKRPMLDQGRAAASAVIAWFKDADPHESALAERIPRVERREDIFPLRVQQTRS